METKTSENGAVLSIIIPTFNAESSIERTVLSILQQKETRYKIIIIDDSSTDRTVNVIEEKFKNEIERGLIRLIKLLHNSGPSIARQEGIKIVTSPYLTFIDADDCYISDVAFNQIISTLDKKQPDLLMFKYITKHRGGLNIKKNYNFPSGFSSLKDSVMAKINSSHPIWHYIWNKCYKTDIIKNNNIEFNPMMKSAEDVRFNEDYLACVQFVYFLNEYFYMYDCTNPFSLTRTKKTNYRKTLADYQNEWEYELRRYRGLVNYTQTLGCYSQCVDTLNINFCKFIYMMEKEVKDKSFALEFTRIIKSDLSEYDVIMKNKSRVKRKLACDRIKLWVGCFMKKSLNLFLCKKYK